MSTPDQPIRAIAIMVGVSIFVPGLDALAKYLTQSYPVMEVVWARYFFHIIFLLPLILWRLGPRAFLPARLPGQLLRSEVLRKDQFPHRLMSGRVFPHAHRLYTESQGRGARDRVITLCASGTC